MNAFIQACAVIDRSYIGCLIKTFEKQLQPLMCTRIAQYGNQMHCTFTKFLDNWKNLEL